MTARTYSFVEEVQALKDGRCKWIESVEFSSQRDSWIRINPNTNRPEWKDGQIGINAIAILGQWTLVDEQPQRVPWAAPEDVPWPCWIRAKGNSETQFLVCEITPYGITFGGRRQNWRDLDLWEHSTDP